MTRVDRIVRAAEWAASCFQVDGKYSTRGYVEMMFALAHLQTTVALPPDGSNVTPNSESEQYRSNPTPVDGPIITKLREFIDDGNDGTFGTVAMHGSCVIEGKVSALLAEIDACRVQDRMGALITDHAQLLAALREVQADAERLEWLQRSVLKLEVWDSESGDGSGWAMLYIDDALGEHHGGGASLRECIDHARRSEVPV